MRLYIFYFVCITLSYGGSTDYFPQCKRSDPEIEKCILEGVEAIKPMLKDGIPEINLPPLEPLKLESLHINTTVTGATLKANIDEIVAHGGSDFKIECLEVDLNNKYVGELKLTLPQLQVSAVYNIEGSKMLVFPINGNGNFMGTFTDIQVVAKGVASPITKEGVEYLHLDSLTTQVTIGKGDLNINPSENTFSGRAALSFIRWNPSVVLKILSPVIDETAASIVIKYLNDVLATVPLKDFLLE